MGRDGLEQKDNGSAGVPGFLEMCAGSRRRRSGMRGDPGCPLGGHIFASELRRPFATPAGKKEGVDSGYLVSSVFRSSALPPGSGTDLVAPPARSSGYVWICITRSKLAVRKTFSLSLSCYRLSRPFDSSRTAYIFLARPATRQHSQAAPPRPAGVSSKTGVLWDVG